jgi:hypothetical protein
MLYQFAPPDEPGEKLAPALPLLTELKITAKLASATLNAKPRK